MNTEDWPETIDKMSRKQLEQFAIQCLAFLTCQPEYSNKTPQEVFDIVHSVAFDPQVPATR
jgi:hypothetical protein